MLKITAITKRGAPIVSRFINEDETLGDVLKIFKDEMSKNPSRQGFLDKWLESDMTIRCKEV